MEDHTFPPSSLALLLESANSPSQRESDVGNTALDGLASFYANIPGTIQIQSLHSSNPNYHTNVCACPSCTSQGNIHPSVPHPSIDS